jgi:hypothetical protein
MNLHKNSYPYKGSLDKSEQQIYIKNSIGKYDILDPKQQHNL